MDDDTKVVQLNGNLTRSLKITSRFPSKVKNMFNRLLRTNTDLFAISPHKIDGIGSTIACL